MIFDNKGILGINARNLLYIRPYNQKKAIKMADDKIKTKQFLSTRGIPVPKLYGIIHNNEELEKYDFNQLPGTFVIKPNNGYGGEGIIPIVGKKDNLWLAAGGKLLSREEIIAHIRDILDGRFSISSIGDCAFFEQYIVADERIGKYSYEGLPDIRIVVHNLIPVMAMLRLPTRESHGKANLHMGAVGVGIDIAKGETTYISYKNKIIDELPDNLGKIRGVKIPFWDDILLISSKIQLITNLGYMAADISIDKNMGPVLIEINARAGLGVQIANLAPLRRRLERIQGVKVTTPVKGVRIAKDMFGNTVEKGIASLSGKEVIGTEEEVEIIQKKGILRFSAKVDTGEERSVIDEEAALKAGLLDNTNEYDDEKSTLKVKLSIKNHRIQTVIDVEKIPSKKYKMIIGNRDLKGFLVDTSQKKQTELKQEKEKQIIEKPTSKRQNFRQIDQQLLSIDNKIKLLYHLRPINLGSEREKFFKDPTQNPQFEYPKLKFDPIELVSELEKIHIDDSPFGEMFKQKKEEISNKIKLLESIGEYTFTEFSTKLFGKPEESEIQTCKNILNSLNIPKLSEEEAIFTAEEAKAQFEETFAKYGLNKWKVKIKEEMVADCVAGKNNSLFVKNDAKFSRKRIESLIVHEIETHILTAENGKIQPYEIFHRGSANYLITQEGLAMYNVEQQKHMPFNENFRALAHVIAINRAITGSFTNIYNELLSYNMTEDQAFRSAVKAKRGLYDTSKPGAFTKDYIYFKGHNQIKEFVEKGGDLKSLYIGKINISDLEKVQKIHGILKAKILPVWIK